MIQSASVPGVLIAASSTRAPATARREVNTFASLIEDNRGGQLASLAEPFADASVLGRRLTQAIADAVAHHADKLRAPRSEEMAGAVEPTESGSVAKIASEAGLPSLAVEPAHRKTRTSFLSPSPHRHASMQNAVGDELKASTPASRHGRAAAPASSHPRHATQQRRGALHVAVQAVDFGLHIVARVGPMDAYQRARLRDAVAGLLAEHGLACSGITLNGEFRVRSPRARGA